MCKKLKGLRSQTVASEPAIALEERRLGNDGLVLPVVENPGYEIDF